MREYVCVCSRASVYNFIYLLLFSSDSVAVRILFNQIKPTDGGGGAACGNW